MFVLLIITTTTLEVIIQSLMTTKTKIAAVGNKVNLYIKFVYKYIISAIKVTT